MAGTIKVDSINADSNLALKIANTAVAFIDATGLRPVAGNLNLDATATSKFYLPSANTVAIQTAGVTAVTVDSSQNVTLAGTLTTTGITNSGVATATRFNPTGSSATGTGMYLPAANTLGLSTNGSEVVRVDSSGNVGIGITSPSTYGRFAVNTPTGGNGVLGVNNSVAGGGGAQLSFYYGTFKYNYIDAAVENGTAGSEQSRMMFSTTNSGTLAERMRIDSNGNLLVGQSSTVTPGTSGDNSEGVCIRKLGNLHVSISGSSSSFNRKSDDGTLIAFNQDGTTEGYIGVSGTTVSYNGAHLSRSAQMVGAKDTSLLKGTVMSNLDEMNEYIDRDGNVVDNEQLNKVKVSNIEGDSNVAGVFVNWDYDEAHQVDEINMAMTGDMIIRIAEGVTVQKGDLLMSAGDGTAKPQGDDIVRSKTIAKVTSNHITCTYADGSYCVPCVLMAC